jgi:5,10-methylene-tetrahydrofolate dehydrogenase/methenyl tetrahydrofolate cyclohydrolase
MQVLTSYTYRRNNIVLISYTSEDPRVHGILVQLPLPAHINEHVVLDHISQEKDVDGLHPLNVAQLANTKTHSAGRASWSFDNINFHVSCTPQVVNNLQS